MARLRAQARRNITSNDYQIRRWWVEKYKRPTNDPSFMRRSWPEWQVEMFEDMLGQRETILERVANGEADAKDAAAAIDALNKVLGDERTVDPLVDKWERELATGKMPNLDEVE